MTVPGQVWSELTAGEDGLDALHELKESGFLRTIEVERSDLFVELFQNLDLGETAAICHAIERDADLVLLDEKEGRKAARRHGLDVTGVVGVLLKAAKADEIDLEPELDALREAGFWISDDLYERALKESEN